VSDKAVNVTGGGARAVVIGGLVELGFFLFLSVCVVTWGWSPQCAVASTQDVEGT
jgi:hypothetical protein